MGQETIVFPENADSQPGFERFETILTVNDLKTRYLHGVDTTDDNGKQMSRKAFEFYISAAISQIEHDFEITINPTEYQLEKHDYKSDDYWNWGYLQLKHKPVISLTHFYIQIADTPLTELPSNWIRLENMTGQVQLAPVEGTISEFNVGNISLLPRLLIFNETFPALFRITYVAGFEQNRVPQIINQAIGLTAALRILSIAGDLVVGAGIANSSLSIDGLSKSVGTTASAMYGAYSARMEDYKNELKKITNILKKYYGKTVKHSVV